MAFFAVPLPRDLKARIAERLEDLKENGPPLAWVHPDDYHITLRFLGGLSALDHTGLSFKPFSLTLQGLSVFPPQRGRGVLWLAIKDAPSALMELQARLDDPSPKQLYTPHLTLGRFASSETEAWMQCLPAFADLEFGSLTCDEYVLMKRRSGVKDAATGPLYEVLARFPVGSFAEASSP